MNDKLRIKSKVITLFQPKSHFIKRRIKQERSHTPQRWSRRIRSLPPIPINVLKTRRPRKIQSVAVKDEPSLSKLALKNSNQKKQLDDARDRKNQVLLRNGAPFTANSLEVVRIVPVMIYIKDDKAKFKSLSDDVVIQIKEKCNTRFFKRILKNNLIGQKFKEECSNLEKKWSKRLKALPLDSM